MTRNLSSTARREVSRPGIDGRSNGFPPKRPKGSCESSALSIYAPINCTRYFKAVLSRVFGAANRGVTASKVFATQQCPVLPTALVEGSGDA
jgi:hypothetical protein